MQAYSYYAISIYYKIDKKMICAKWSRAIALLLHKEKLGLLESLVFKVLKEQLQYSVT
jgi:hypothetical protein